MLIYQVHRFKGGYTLIELLTVILIIGLFFYFVAPSVRNILPEKENEKVLELVDFIEKASWSAMEQDQKIIFAVDIDTNSCSAVPEDDNGESRSSSFVHFSLDFIKGCNSSAEVSSGLITFLFFPDGSKEFGTILVEDIEKGDTYTIFLNPYAVFPEVIKGEAKFEEVYTF